MDVQLHNAKMSVFELAVRPNCLCMLDTLSRVVLLCVLDRLIIVVVFTPHNPQSQSWSDADHAAFLAEVSRRGVSSISLAGCLLFSPALNTRMVDACNSEFSVVNPCPLVWSASDGECPP